MRNMKSVFSLLLVVAMLFALSVVAVADDDPYAGLAPMELVGADSSGKGADAQLLGELITAKLDEITGGKLTVYKVVVNSAPLGRLMMQAHLVQNAVKFNNYSSIKVMILVRLMV